MKAKHSLREAVSARGGLLLLLAGWLFAAGGAGGDTLLVPSEYATIQAAIDAAADGDLISIAPGTYPEQIVIEKDLALVGETAGVTLVAPAALETRFVFASDPMKPIVYVHGATGVSLENLVIDGLDLGGGNEVFVGVAVHDADAALGGLEITRLRELPATAAESGIGVVAFADAGTARSVTLTDCYVDAYQKGAVVASGADLSFEAGQCMFHGPGHDLGAATPIGVHVRDGAYAVLLENDVCWHLSADPQAGPDPLTQVQSAGVYLEDAHPSCQLSDNSLTQNDVAVALRGSAEIGANLLIENRYAGLVLSGGEVAVHNVNFQGHHEVGIWVIGRDAFTRAHLTTLCLGGPGGDGTDESLIGIRAYGEEMPVEVLIEQATITMWNTGVRADGDAQVTLRETGLYGNALAGFDNRFSQHAQDATFCWWGDPGGPPPIGIGDPILGENVQHEPMLISGTDTQVVCGLQRDANTVGPLQPAECLSIEQTVIEDIPIVLDRTDTAEMRGYSVVFSLSDGIQLAGGVSAITEGAYLTGDPPVATTYFAATELSAGTYKVDCAILGEPCGPNTSPGMLFYIDVEKTPGQPDGTGILSVVSADLRDCENVDIPAVPGADAEITVDTEAPAAVADLGATQVKSGNDTGGTTLITVTFNPPVDAEVVEVYRAPFGDYPEYDDAAGAEPAAPAYPPGAPWELTGVTASGETDDPAARDVWYYVVFTQDPCGNWSAVSNRTGGTLSYHLGDVAGTPPDNQVTTGDISHLSPTYFHGEGDAEYRPECDVGPTTDYTVDGRPLTDNEVGFEDLMMFAINFGLVSATGRAPIATVRETPGDEEPLLVLTATPSGDDRGLLEAQLVLLENTDWVKGLHAEIAYDAAALTLLDVAQGEWLGQSGPVFAAHHDFGGRVVFDAALLGTGTTFGGSGEVATLRFQVTDPAAALPVLETGELRDAGNARVGEQAAAVTGTHERAPASAPAPPPGTTALLGARPNPFLGLTRLDFSLAEPSQVSLLVYDASGRRVRTLVDRTLEPGLHQVAWDGTLDRGGRAPVGVYLCTFRAGEIAQSVKLFHYR